MHAGDAAQIARLDHLDHPPVIGLIVVNVVAHLCDALILQRGVRQHPPLRHIVAERLLDEHVLARFERAQ